MANDIIKVLQEVRGTGAPGAAYTDGIYWDITQNDHNGNAGIYGDILDKHSAIGSSNVVTSAAVIAAAASATATASDVITTNSNVTSIQLKAWVVEAIRLTADSYATEAEDVFVKVYTSNNNGAFIASPTTEYSALHWASKSVKSMALKADKESPTFTGNVGGITKSMVGLDKVDNTTDLSKPISNAVQDAITAITVVDAANLSMLIF